MKNNNTITTATEVLNKYRKALDSISIDFVADYLTYDINSSNYICDCISNCADDNVDIYYSDLLDFVREYPDLINDTVKEFGIDAKNFDIYDVARDAEFMHNDYMLYNDFDNIIEYAAMIIANKMGIIINDPENEMKILEAISDIDSCSRVFEIAEAITTEFEIED